MRRREPRGDSTPASSEFALALASLRDAPVRPEVLIEETPAPSRLAPHAVALSGELLADEEELASGRFVLLHDPAGQDPWEGTLRVVTFVRARIELEMAADPLLGAVAWSWLADSLDDHRAHWRAPSGTVTRTCSESFGAIEARETVGEVELRASWTPTDADAGSHLAAWADLLAHLAGLPPLPQGVTVLGRR